jgi:hypothetical protein
MPLSFEICHDNLHFISFSPRNQTFEHLIDGINLVKNKMNYGFVHNHQFEHIKKLAPCANL